MFSHFTLIHWHKSLNITISISIVNDNIFMILQTTGGYLIFYKLVVDESIKTVYDLIDSPNPSLKRDCVELFVKENIPSINLFLVISSETPYALICDAFQEKVTYFGKMNFEFSTKLGSGHLYQHVPEEYKAYCSIKPEKRAYKLRILKNVILRKSPLKFLEDLKRKKFISQHCLYQFGCKTSEVYMY